MKTTIIAISIILVSSIANAVCIDGHPSIKDEYAKTISLVEKLNGISDSNRFTYYVYLPYPGAPLFDRAVKLGLKIPSSLIGWSNYLLSPEDAFKIITRQKWISPKMAKRVNMLSQYVFALMDKSTIMLIEKLPDGPYKFIYKKIFFLARKIALLRFKYKFFSLSVDYFIFNWLHKHGKLD